MICLLQVPALGVLFQAFPDERFALEGGWEMSSPRGSFETELENELCLIGVKTGSGNQDHQGTQQHGLWQLSEGTEKAP